MPIKETLEQMIAEIPNEAIPLIEFFFPLGDIRGRVSWKLARNFAELKNSERAFGIFKRTYGSLSGFGERFRLLALLEYSSLKVIEDVEDGVELYETVLEHSRYLAVDDLERLVEYYEGNKPALNGFLTGLKKAEAILSDVEEVRKLSRLLIGKAGKKSQEARAGLAELKVSLLDPAKAEAVVTNLTHYFREHNVLVSEENVSSYFAFGEERFGSAYHLGENFLYFCFLKLLTSSRNILKGVGAGKIPFPCLNLDDSTDYLGCVKPWKPQEVSIKLPFLENALSSDYESISWANTRVVVIHELLHFVHESIRGVGKTSNFGEILHPKFYEGATDLLAYFFDSFAFDRDLIPEEHVREVIKRAYGQDRLDKVMSAADFFRNKKISFGPSSRTGYQHVRTGAFIVQEMIDEEHTAKFTEAYLDGNGDRVSSLVYQKLGELGVVHTFGDFRNHFYSGEYQKAIAVTGKTLEELTGKSAKELIGKGFKCGVDFTDPRNPLHSCFFSDSDYYRALRVLFPTDRLNPFSLFLEDYLPSWRQTAVNISLVAIALGTAAALLYSSFPGK